jgi:hypothetical protein
MDRLPDDHPSAGFQLASPRDRMGLVSPVRVIRVPAASSMTSPGSPGTKLKALKADVVSIKETVEHIQDIIASDVSEAIATTLGNESNLSWLSKKFEDHSVAIRSSFRNLELSIESVTTKLKEVTELAEETYKEAPTYSQVEALSKRMKSMEAALSEIREGSGDLEASKKVRVLSREKESLTEAVEELAEKLRKSEKSTNKLLADLARKEEQLTQVTTAYQRDKEKQEQQHKRRSEAAEKAWQQRKTGYSKNKSGAGEPSEEKPAASSSSSSSSSSSLQPVPQMRVADPYAPGGEFNRLGLGTGKPPKQLIKKSKVESESESSEEYSESDEERDQVREAWRKKSKGKKSSKDESKEESDLE